MRLEVKKNAKRNIMVGLINNTVVLILPFVTRSIINSLLGSMYLGMNSLFSSILTVLSLSEMGLSGAMVYHMYKPIADGDVSRINALLALYKKAYRIIGLAIIGMGVCLVPFLHLLIKGAVLTGVNVYVIYLIELFSTSLSYLLFAYRSSMLAAHQRVDVTTITNLFISVGLKISQIIVLLVTKNYYLYVIVTPVFTVLNNVWIAYITKKMYPQYKPEGRLDRETLSSIKKLVAGTFIQKACVTTRNSLDSIFISVFLGLTLTGIYNNYYTIFSAVLGLMAIISNALSGGIGNHVALKSVDENFEELKQLDFLYMTIAGVCTSCLLCLYQPFMRIWMGGDMLLDFPSVVLLCVYFYTLKMGDMKAMYASANGLWWKMRYRAIIETITNILLNIILGATFGVNGIIIATTVSLFVCNFIWGSIINFNSYFGPGKLVVFFKYHFIGALKTVVFCGISYSINLAVDIGNPYFDLICKTFIAIVIPLLLYFVTSCKTELFRKSIKMVKK